MAARERARDSQRKSDLRQIQKALELYKQDQASASFPASVACDSATCFPYTGGQWLNVTTNSIYMNFVPRTQTERLIIDIIFIPILRFNLCSLCLS